MFEPCQALLAMPNLLRPLLLLPPAIPALSVAIVRGLIEWLALWRCRRREHDAMRASPAEPR
jgi:hypothetical protein